MGCTTCKISEIETEFFRTCRENNTQFFMDFEPIISLADRNFWTQELSLKGTPEEDFWEEFNGFHHSCFCQI